MAAKTKKQSETGESWVKRNNRSMVWVTLDEEQKKKVRRAAAELNIPMSQFAQKAIMELAEKILEKSEK